MNQTLPHGARRARRSGKPPQAAPLLARPRGPGSSTSARRGRWARGGWAWCAG